MWCGVALRSGSEGQDVCLHVYGGDGGSSTGGLWCRPQHFVVVVVVVVGSPLERGDKEGVTWRFMWRCLCNMGVWGICLSIDGKVYHERWHLSDMIVSTVIFFWCAV